MKSGRRGFLGGALGLAVATGWARPGLAAAQQGTGQRLVETYITPAMREFQRSATAMHDLLKQSCQGDTHLPSKDLVEAFRALTAAWSRIAFLRFGPLVADNRFERILFWPDPRGVMLRQISPLIQSQQPLDDLHTHSVAVQGLPALEYVLYGKQGLLAAEADADQSGAGKLGACQYAAAVAGNLEQVAHALWQAWKPDGDYAKDFGRPGEHNTYYRNAHEVLAETIKALSAGLRFETDVKLRTMLGAQQDKAKPKTLPFWRSGLALNTIAESAQGMADFHQAAGFEVEPDWLRRSVDQEMRQSADVLLSHQGHVLDLNEDEDLYRELTLVVLKLNNARRIVDENLAPLLGVGMGFNALDGD